MPLKSINEQNFIENLQIAAYAEICTSYHAVVDFRTKLLGLLPTAVLKKFIKLN